MGPWEDYPNGNPSGGGGYYGDSGGVIGAAIGAGASLYDSYQNRKLARENTDKTLAANKREAELAYQRQVAERNYMNMYNSPESEMQRFVEAGLNPHLMYGKGTAGDQSFTPQYQPARQEYNYAPMQVSGALSGILPTLMAVGTWMQNMRLSEAELKQRSAGTTKVMTDTERLRQVVSQLAEMNPKLLQQADIKTGILGHQKDATMYQRDKARQTLFEVEQSFRQKFGDDLFQQMGSHFSPGGEWKKIGGTEKLKYMREEAETRLKQAQASWSDFDITNPQQIMMMVLQGVMGMAGAQLRLSKGSRSAAPIKSERAKPRERPRGLNRRRMSINHPDR